MAQLRGGIARCAATAPVSMATDGMIGTISSPETASSSRSRAEAAEVKENSRRPTSAMRAGAIASGRSASKWPKVACLLSSGGSFETKAPPREQIPEQLNACF